jgi:hypothetical protein
VPGNISQANVAGRNLTADNSEVTIPASVNELSIKINRRSTVAVLATGVLKKHNVKDTYAS